MNRKQIKTLERIFEKPSRSDIEFKDIVNLLIALGFERIDGRGSRISFKSHEGRIIFHRPHPGKEIKTYVVDYLRDFLFSIGITPKGIANEENKRH